MSVGGWITAWFGNGSPSGTVTATSPRKGAVINSARGNLILLGSLRPSYPLDRGSRTLGLFPAVADTYEDHPEYVDAFVVDWDKLRGDDSGLDWNVVAIVELRCENASTTARACIVLAGASTPLVESAIHNTTSWAPQTLVIPESTGVKTYRLQVKRSTLDHEVYCIGYGRTYAPEPTA